MEGTYPSSCPYPSHTTLTSPFILLSPDHTHVQVSNNAPIPLASLTPGTVEVDVCATRLSLPTSSMHEGVETGGRFPDVGETVWYTL